MFKFLIRVLHKLKLLRFFNITASIDVDGKKVQVPLRGEVGYSNFFLTEPWMTQTLKQLKPVFTGTFVDVGVNIGQTLIKAYSVYDKLHYTGFEPNPTCVHYMQHLIKLNGFKNCNLLPVGINSQTEMLKLNFYYDEDTDQSASIVTDFRPDQPINHSDYVPVFNGNNVRDILPVQQHPILKIDVEGAELEVIKGLQDWIVQCQPLILVEILPVYKADNTFRIQRQQEMEGLLRNWNYRIARLIKNDTVSLKPLDTIEVHADMELCDYLIFPASLSDKIFNCFREKQTA